MPEYVLLMYGPAEGGARKADGTVITDPEDFKAEHQRWMQFDQDLKAAGLFIDNRGLAGVEAATTVKVRDGETQITDGPFAETKELLAGYFLIDAPDLDTAIEWAAKIPSASWGSVEVRPVWG
jgi:hypothetical protein